MIMKVIAVVRVVMLAVLIKFLIIAMDQKRINKGKKRKKIFQWKMIMGIKIIMITEEKINLIIKFLKTYNFIFYIIFIISS